MFTQFNHSTKVAYFSMEIGLDSSIPTYSGGLGVLAGDTLKAASDLGIPLMGVTLLYRKGYFKQHVDQAGKQFETPFLWEPEKKLEKLDAVVEVLIENRLVLVTAWKYLLKGIRGSTVPIYFLDTSLKENTPFDRTITDSLYGGDSHTRICQELILGFGGFSLLKTLGYHDIHTYHMNEGHSAFLTLALLEDRMKSKGDVIENASIEDRCAIKEKCVFTTHTPVPAGHDQFDPSLSKRMLGADRIQVLEKADCAIEPAMNMTQIALCFSRYVNGVAMRHGQVSRSMFPNYPISSITNGIHVASWVSEPFKELYDRTIPEWRVENLFLRHAIDIPLKEIQKTHYMAKQRLLAKIKKKHPLNWTLICLLLVLPEGQPPTKEPILFFRISQGLKKLSIIRAPFN